MSLYAVALIFVFTGIKTPCQTQKSGVFRSPHIFVHFVGENVVAKVAKR